MVPWLEMPIIYDIRPKPRMIQSLTGSKGQCRPSFLVAAVDCT